MKPILFLVLISGSIAWHPAAAAPAGPRGGRRAAAPEVAAEMRDACPRIAFIKRNSYGMRGTNAVMFAQRTESGSAICTLDPGGTEKIIFETERGFIFNMNPSYDGKSLVFSYKEEVDQPFHVWEIGADGSGLRQLTSGPYHDFSPVYYPDGRIVFSSSRSEGYSLCQDYLACALHIINGDGSDLRRIDHTTICTLTPAVLSDGSILCTRWEYQDKNIFGWEGLWTIHPNGRQLQLYHGNTFRVPNAVYGGREIPGTRRVIVVWAAHHHPPVGDLAIVDRSLGLETADSMWKITHATPVEKDLASGDDWRKTGVGTGDADRYFRHAYADPYPFTGDLTLVSFGGDEPGRHDLYILDHNSGESCLLHRSDASCFSPVPLGPRPRPRAIPGDCPQGPGEGSFYVLDVYQGLLEQGVERGLVKAIRVMSQPQKKYNTEGARYHDHYPVIGHGSYYPKVIHGSAPVAGDGSAYFTAPANTELYFIALDADGKEVQRMGSVTQITPGEEASCVGCHENRLAPPPVLPRGVRHIGRKPDTLRPPPWGAGAVDFVRQVQPVFDRYCVRCHAGPSADRGIDLSGGKTRFYNIAYETLVFDHWVDYYYINRGPNGVFPALATGSWVSRLTKLIEEEHGGVVVDDAGRRAIYAWIDANVPYYPVWEMTRPHTIGGRDAYARTRPGQGPEAAGGQGGRLIEVEGWVAEFNAFAARHPAVAPISMGGPNTWADRGAINLSRPGWSPVVLANLAESAGGRAADDKALFKSTADPAYRELLAILAEAKAALDAVPRIDMPGAKVIPQERDFGRVF